MSVDAGYDEPAQGMTNAHWQMPNDWNGGDPRAAMMRGNGQNPSARPEYDPSASRGQAGRNPVEPEAYPGDFGGSPMAEGIVDRPTNFQPDALPSQRGPATDRMRATPRDRLSPVDPWKGRGAATNPQRGDEYSRASADHNRQHYGALQQIEAERRRGASGAEPMGSAQYYNPGSDDLKAYDEMRTEVGTQYNARSVQPGPMDGMQRGAMEGMPRGGQVPQPFRRSPPSDDGYTN
jgi:hypothetical protein